MRSTLRAAIFIGGAVAASAVAAQQGPPAAPVRTVEVKPGLAVLYGTGGNVGVAYGPDGTLLVDDQFAPMVPGLQAAVAGLGASPARFVVNTHWHWDHAAGNALFGAAGATIVAHESVRGRIARGGTVMGIPSDPGAPEALPVLTFQQGMSFHLNGDTLDVMYLGGGHTDGDAVVFWREKNVVHMGDLFMKEQGWPFVDVASGGNVEHLLVSLAQVIARIDDATVVIPGHGELADKADLIAFRTMVATGVDRIRALKEAGRTLEEALAAKPVAGLSGRATYVPDDDFVTAVWASLDNHAD